MPLMTFKLDGDLTNPPLSCHLSSGGRRAQHSPLFSCIDLAWHSIDFDKAIRSQPRIVLRLNPCFDRRRNHASTSLCPFPRGILRRRHEHPREPGLILLVGVVAEGVVTR